MTSYTYDESSGYYVSDDGVHVSSEAYDAIQSFSKASTKTTKEWSWTAFWEEEYLTKDRGIYELDSGQSEFNNKYSQSTTSYWWTSVPYKYTYKYYSLVIGNDEDNVIYGPTQNSHVSGRGITIYAGLGNDTIYGGDGSDTIYAETGNNVVYGRKGDNTIYGGDGDDILVGGNDNDTIYGGGGDNLIYSGSLFEGSSNVLTGGSGSNTFVLGKAGEVSSEVAGVDWDSFAETAIKSAVNLVMMTPGVGLSVKVAKTAIYAGLDLYNIIVDGQEVIDTSDPFASYTKVTDFNPTTDVLILPVSSTDLSNVFLSDNLTNGGYGFTVMYQNGSSSNIVADINYEDSATIFGEMSTSWSQTMADAYYDAMLQNALIITADGVAYDFTSGGLADISDDDLADMDGTAYILMGAYSGWYVYGDSGNNVLVGTSYDDVIYGYIPDPSIAGYTGAENAGDDVIYLIGGNNYVQAGAGNDYIFGGTGSDTSAYTDSPSGIYVDLSTTYSDVNGSYALADDGFGTTDRLYDINNIFGSLYDDVIIGSTGDNVLAGIGGDNVIYGVGGDNTIYGGTGFDSIYGGTGNDSIYVGSGGGYYDGGSGTNTLYFINTDNGILVDLGQDIVSDDGFGNGIEILNFQNVYGSGHDDIIIGNEYDNVLYGADGENSIYGVSGNNILVGGIGDDALYGGDGNDVLISTGGDDILTGGEGYNTFVLAGGYVTITDFDPDTDTILIYAGEYDGTLSRLDDEGAYTGDSISFYDENGTAYLTFADTDYDAVFSALDSSERGYTSISYSRSDYVLDLTDYSDMFA
ncbi:hypothetical protein [Roseibium sp. RKSG952]|uniref:hypothetical protein n=1 Tax=Roseibium sp. RKSG952 TaxID=2529384 RepID=UPI0012BCC72D|nr:hypothetical protein [Roseibium sp. RKSG952]MTH98222.1 hypothetical protein [Roseibium sp. RKSG952]